MRTIFKSVALASTLLIVAAANSTAADICDESGFASVPTGQIRISDESSGEWIEFRTSASILQDRYGHETSATEAVLARQAARDAIYRAFARIVRPPAAAAPLDMSGLQSVVAVCDGENIFDFRVPLSGLKWRSEPEGAAPAMLPPIRKFLRDNGVID